MYSARRSSDWLSSRVTGSFSRLRGHSLRAFTGPGALGAGTIGGGGILPPAAAATDALGCSAPLRAPPFFSA
eukprot:3484412-Prymnesium_polylepis.1